MAAGQLFGPTSLCALFTPLAQLSLAGRSRSFLTALDSKTSWADQVCIRMLWAFGHVQNLALYRSLAAR